jgi:hypothetical protein
VLLVIFGAGASFDSVPHLPPGEVFPAVRPAFSPDYYENFRPPLANQLFDTRPLFVEAMVRFWQFQPLIPLLRKQGIAVEQELAKFQEQAKTLPRVNSELAAIRYYLHLALWECQRLWDGIHRGITNYATLLREIERWRYEFNEQVCFVTFNYDTMLEDAMRQVLRFKIISLNSYVSEPNYALIKLHGSVNWGREVDVPEPRRYTLERIIEEAADLPVSDRYSLVDSYPMLIQGEQLVFPALSIPVEKKDQFSCPPTHRQALEKMLPNVTKIMTVGWRAREAEFLNMLQSRLTGEVDMLIVSGSGKDTMETYDNLSQSVKSSGHTDAEHGFTGLINEGYLEGFLRR